MKRNASFRPSSNDACISSVFFKYTTIQQRLGNVKSSLKIHQANSGRLFNTKRIFEVIFFF